MSALTKDAPLSQKDFGDIVRQFAFHAEQSRFLLETNAINEKLAETLLVFRKKLARTVADNKDLTLVIDQLFLHYVINTNGPILQSEDEDPFDVFDVAARYAGLLCVGVSKDSEGSSLLQIDEKEVSCPNWGMMPGSSAAQLLRNIGPVINRVRYGRDDVIPSYAFGFNESAVTHTLENAMTLADFAHLAYFKPSYVEKQLKEWGYDSFTWIENVGADTQLFVAGKDQHLVVCFRGTSSWKDGLVDLNFLKTEAFGGVGKVHRGFQKALDSVWSEVQSAVDKMGADKKLFICGHSLGAALAQLAAHRFALAKYNIEHIYVFGSPRVANREFMQHYNELLEAKTFLHVNHKDVVTTVPLELLGFHHLGGKPRSFDKGHVIASTAVAARETAELEFEQLDEKTQEDMRTKMSRVDESIRASIKFLTTDPNQLSGGKYETNFNSGAADEHSMDQYLFKFACAIVDGNWKQIRKKKPSR